MENDTTDGGVLSTDQTQEEQMTLPDILDTPTGWVLNQQLATYLEMVAHTNLPKEKLDIFKFVLPPSNVLIKHKLDQHLKEMLDKSKAKMVLDEGLQAASEHLVSALGPLSQGWSTAQQLNNMLKSATSNEEVLKHTADIVTCFNAGITLLGQSLQRIGYERRLNVLASVSGSTNEAKQRLRDQEGLLAKRDTDELFGPKFLDIIKEARKDKDAFQKAVIPTKTNVARGRGQTRLQRGNGAPFRGGSSNSRGRASYQAASSRGSGTIHPPFYKNPKSPFERLHSGGFSGKPFGSSMYRGKAQTFSTPMGVHYEGPVYPSNPGGLQNPPCESPVPSKGTSPNSIFGGGKTENRKGNERNARRASHSPSPRNPQSIGVESFRSTETRRGSSSPNIKPATSECRGKVPTFQNGIPGINKNCFTTRGLDDQNRSKKCILAPPNLGESQKVSAIQVGGPFIKWRCYHSASGVHHSFGRKS